MLTRMSIMFIWMVEEIWLRQLDKVIPVMSHRVISHWNQVHRVSLCVWNKIGNRLMVAINSSSPSILKVDHYILKIKQRRGHTPRWTQSSCNKIKLLFISNQVSLKYEHKIYWWALLMPKLQVSGFTWSITWTKSKPTPCSPAEA